MSTVLFIDFEAFQHGDEDYQIKELCILDADSPLKPLTFMFQPSTPWDKLSSDRRRTYAYQEHHLHHLAWNEGDIRYCTKCIFHHIQSAFPLVAGVNTVCYVLGSQKTSFLQRELPMLNIYQYDNAFAYKDLPMAPLHLTCTYRNHSRNHCAVLKCYQLFSHFESL